MTHKRCDHGLVCFTFLGSFSHLGSQTKSYLLQCDEDYMRTCNVLNTLQMGVPFSFLLLGPPPVPAAHDVLTQTPDRGPL